MYSFATQDKMRILLIYFKKTQCLFLHVSAKHCKDLPDDVDLRKCHVVPIHCEEPAHWSCSLGPTRCSYPQVLLWPRSTSIYLPQAGGSSSSFLLWRAKNEQRQPTNIPVRHKDLCFPFLALTSISPCADGTPWSSLYLTLCHPSCCAQVNVGQRETPSGPENSLAKGDSSSWVAGTSWDWLVLL